MGGPNHQGSVTSASWTASLFMDSFTLYVFIHSDLSQVEQVAGLLSSVKHAKGEAACFVAACPRGIGSGGHVSSWSPRLCPRLCTMPANCMLAVGAGMRGAPFPIPFPPCLASVCGGWKRAGGVLRAAGCGGWPACSRAPFDTVYSACACTHPPWWQRDPLFLARLVPLPLLSLSQSSSTPSTPRWT